MKGINKIFIGFCSIVFIISGFSAPKAYSADNEFEYPELLVSPRASERLKLEAKKESSVAWTTHLSIQASAFMTFVSGVLTMDDTSRDTENPNNPKWAGYTGMGVGAGWLVLTGILSASYRPYIKGLKSIKKLPNKTKSNQITRERLAEEALYAPASLAWKLNMLSVVSNFGASVYMLSASKDRVSNVVAGLALITAFTPILFHYHWQDVAKYHEEYKKKIYGPVTSATVLFKKIGHRKVPVPAMAVSFNF